MARPKLEVPSYSLHRPTGQAFLRINGKPKYLGKYGSPTSKELFAKIVAELGVAPAEVVQARYSTTGSSGDYLQN